MRNQVKIDAAGTRCFRWAKGMLLFGCLLFVACIAGNNGKTQARENTTLEVDSQKTKSEEGNICMALSQTRFASAPKKVTLSIMNNSPWNCFVGYEYVIEAEKKQEWTKVPLKDGAFYDVALGIAPKTTRKFQIDLGNVSRKYKKGTYRIVKEARIETSEGYRDTTCYCLFWVL